MRGTVLVVTPPVATPIDLADAKRHLRIEPADTDEDEHLTAVIAAATAPLEGPAGWLGRALIKQKLELRLDECPLESIRLPCPPLVELESVSYVDGNGATVTVGSDDYQVVNRGENISSIVPAYGKSWPSSRCEPQAVRVSYWAGYGEKSTDVPAEIRHARSALACAPKNLHLGILTIILG